MLKDGVEERTGAAILERGDELQRIGRVLDAAGAGEGGLIVVAATAGMGKTKLLEATVEDAAAVGLRPLIARAGELERGFAFGVVRQLVEAPVLAADDAGRAELLSGAAARAAAALDLDPGTARDQDVHVTLHGLFWLLANLAAASPLLVAVDDIQWADDASLRWLAYVVRRLDRLPAAVIVTARADHDRRVELSGDAGEARRAAIAEVVAHAPALSLRPAPLSEAGVSRLLEVRLGQHVDPEFASAARAQTGGNPFLVSELAAELQSQGLSPRAANAERLARVVPDRVGEMIRRRLLRVSPDARRLATSLAVLGEGGELTLAAELAGLEPDRARSAAAELVTSLILADAPAPRFGHPLLRAAVESEASALELGSLHRRAAELLAERGAPAGRIATHLLPSAPGGEAWVVERLGDAARSARSQGATEQAAALLRRALAESPPRELRAALLGELGEVELASRHEEAAEPLREALELTSQPQTRADLTLALALALYHLGRHAEAVDVLLATIAEIDRDDALRERRLQLESFLALAGRYDVETEERTRGRIQKLAAAVDGSTPGERLVLATAASERPGPTADDLFHSTRASERVTREIPWPDPVEGIGFVGMYLHAGRPDAAAEAVESLLAKARQEGSPLRNAIAVGARGMVELDGGNLRAADSDLAECLEALHDLGDLTLAHRSAGLRLISLAHMGRFEDAERLLAEYELGGRLPERMYYNPSLYGRGVLRLEQRRFADAEADFRELGRRHELWRMERPVPPWRSGAALALIARGEQERAAELAADELELAHVWDTPKAIAIATGALALTRHGHDAIDGLSEAVALLEDTPWRLDRARARCDLGAAFRRAGRRREGREQLALAMDEANACGAEPLAERAAGELRASGARPRRRAISGLDALTPSERRVADLAAAGRTNREIAQELFVTTATVETHLTRVYRKLDLDGREGLPAALTPEAQ